MKKQRVLILIALTMLLILTAKAAQIKPRTYRIDEIKTLSSSYCGGYLSPYYHYEWDFETLTYTFSCRNSGSSDVEEYTHVYAFSAEDAEKMTAACNQYGAFNWKEQYGNEYSCEAGDSFCITFRDGTYRYTSFHGVQPPHYQEVYAALFSPEPDQPDLAETLRSVEICDFGGYLSPYRTETWDFETHSYTYSVKSSGSADVDEWEKTHSFSEAEAAELLEACSRYGVFSLIQDEDPDNWSDGAGTWIRLHFADGTERKNYFCEHKPQDYDEWLAEMRQPIPDDIKSQ